MDSICSITPTICKLMGIPPPASSGAGILDEVVEAADALGIEAITRCLIFSPDAIGTILVRKYGHLFAPLEEYAPARMDLRSVFPPKTPVCYASMFTGALPDVHGIVKYVKQAPGSETIFDVMTGAGKKAAIVAVQDSSLDTIFRATGVEQLSETYDKAVTERTVQLIEADRHDLIVAYQQEYDDLLHRGHPESQVAMAAVGRHVGSFLTLAGACRRAWGGHRYLILFSPDHGAQLDPATGTGTHGDDVPEDMGVTHFFGFGPAG